MFRKVNRLKNYLFSRIGCSAEISLRKGSYFENTIATKRHFDSQGAKGTQALEHMRDSMYLRHSGTWALGHSCTWGIGHLRGTRTLGHSSTWALEALEALYSGDSVQRLQKS